MRRRLDIAASLVASPRVLFLDEPTTGLDPHGRLAVWDLLDELIDQGTSLLVTTQYLEEADRLADRVVVLGDGRVVAEGTPSQLKQRFGGYRLELRTAIEDANDVATALEGWGDGPLHADRRSGRVTAPVRDGLEVLTGLRTRLADAHVGVLDVSLHRPTLDDVFLALTGDPKSTDVPETIGHGSTTRGTGGRRVSRRLSRPRLGRPATTSLGISMAVITRRNLLRLKRIPTLIALATVQPIFFVVLFTSVFGGAIDPPGVDAYVDYLLPGLFVLAIGFGASQTGVAIAEDRATGMTDRFRSLPLPGLAVLMGRVAADAVRNSFVVGLMLAVGTMIGFRFHAGSLAALATIVLAIAIGLALSWINISLGLLVRDAESAGLAGLFPLIVLVFTSSTLVPIETMPGWLQAFAELNPITILVDALRVLVLGGPTAQPVLQATAWIGALLAVAMPLTVHQWRRASS